MHRFPVGGGQPETAAMLDVQVSKIKTKYIQLAAIDDHHLAVIAQQVVGGARHGNASRQESHFQRPEILLAAAVSKGNEGMDQNPSAHGVSQRSFNLGP